MPVIESMEIMAGVVQLTFNRPEKMNALSVPLMAEFEAALDAVATDPAIRVLVLRGAGGRAFVAGADIGEYRGERARDFMAFQRTGRRIFDKLERLEQPTICAIEGFALGGGFEIALACDIILCAEGSQMGLPEGRLGLCPGGGGTQRLVRAVGKHAASDLMLAGWRMDADRAHALGLCSEVVAAEALDAVVAKRARACLKIAPLAQAEMKRLMREGADAPVETAKSLEQEVLSSLYQTSDAKEGIDAFLEKRDPQFRGE